MALPDDLAKKLATASRKSAHWHQTRDALILEAHNAGGGLREIARAVGMSHPAVKGIIERDSAPLGSS